MKREDFESLGDKHKQFENLNQRMMMPNMPIMVRLDGRAFHTFTKGLKRPYDERMSVCMQETTKELVKQTNAYVGYTQSDEISLIIPNELFGGRVAKINSILAGIASVAFNKLIAKHIPEKANALAVFDCRCWQYPSYDMYVESLAWREADATRNSLTMACHSVYSHKELHQAGFTKKHDMLHAKGINWNDYPAFFKRGSYFARRDRLMEIDDETWNKIPPKNRPESREYVRSVIVGLGMPPISKVVNINDVVFNRTDPIVAAEPPKTQEVRPYHSCYSVTNQAILGFFEEHRFLSNFEHSPFRLFDIEWKTNEHFYMAMKTRDWEERLHIAALETPAEARKYGRNQVKLRPDWDSIRIQVMTVGCYEKFKQNPHLLEKLLATGDKYLEETNYWNDTFWGVCNGIGESHLGKVLMHVRHLFQTGKELQYNFDFV